MRAGRLRTGWEGHLLLAYRAPTERAVGLAAWARNGLEQGEKVLLAESSGTAADALVPLLERQGVRAAEAAEAGSLAVCAVDQLCSPHSVRAAVERALVEGFVAVRLTARTSGQRSSLTPWACGVFEESLELFCATGRLSALCQYDRSGSPDLLARAVGDHLGGLRTTMLTTRCLQDGLALAGEVDISNVDLFAAAVEGVTRGAGAVVWLDLADLRFMDVAGCRALARTTRIFRNSGGALLLVDPLPPVSHVLSLLGVDRLRGIELVGR